MRVGPPVRVPMYSNSRGIMYSSSPTAEEHTEEEASNAEEPAAPDVAETTVTEADANWTGELAADD